VIHEANIGDLCVRPTKAKVGKDGKAETDEAGKMLTLRKQLAQTSVRSVARPLQGDRGR